MKITLLENNEEIRRKFVDRFVMSWDEFQVRYKDSANHPGIDWFGKSYLWDRFHRGIPIVSFSSALSALKEHTESVLIMSEDNIYHPGELFHDNKKYTNFVARVNAKELANLIEKEWDSWYDSEEDIWFTSKVPTQPILPEDLYVFDESMKWFIAFTHESAYIDPPNYIRHCILYIEK